jgi:hypothetical protein
MLHSLMASFDERGAPPAAGRSQFLHTIRFAPVPGGAVARITRIEDDALVEHRTFKGNTAEAAGVAAVRYLQALHPTLVATVVAVDSFPDGGG